MDKTDFNIIAHAILLYYEQQNSLFADYFISEKLHTDPEIIRSKISNWFHATPEELLTYLEPETIKRRISKTAMIMKKEHENHSNVQIEAMTEKELENDGTNLNIHYQFAKTCFGPIIVASTENGVCYLAFSDEGDTKAFNKLKSRFPNACLQETGDSFQQNVLLFLEHKESGNDAIHLHLKGTPYQINIWKKLLEIPRGGLMSYSALTTDKKNSHALGAAVGSNPVAYIIPCHRTVRASGEFGDYHWGKARKAAFICWEAVSSYRKE